MMAPIGHARAQGLVGAANVATLKKLEMKIGDLVRYRNVGSTDCGIVLEHGDYAFACDILIYWFKRQRANAERTGDLTVLTVA